jgi:RNA polymerase sigma factor (sigma-70 family)
MQVLWKDAVTDGPRLAELVRRIAAAEDRAAFAELFGLLAPRVKSFLLRQGCDGGMAEELTQDVMLVVWHRAKVFDSDRATVTTWVFTIARNRRIDRLRRERSVEPDPDDPLFVEGLARSPDTDIEIAERQARLHHAIAELPEEQAELIHMAYFQDKPHTGIASERNLPLGTVKSRLRLALLRLKKVLVRDGGP